MARDRLFVENKLAGAKYHRLYHDILRRDDLTMGARVAHAVLVSYATLYAEVFPGIERLADDLASSRHSVMRYIKELEGAGLLRVERPKGGSTNHYTLLDWTKEQSSKLQRSKSGRSGEQGSNLQRSDLRPSPANLQPSGSQLATDKRKEPGKKRTGRKKNEPDAAETAGVVWDRVRGELSLMMSTPNYEQCTDGVEAVALTDDELVLRVENPLTRETIRQRYLQHLVRALYDVTGRAMRITLT